MLMHDKMTAVRWFGAALLLAFAPAAHADDWPQWLGPKRDGVWREGGLIDKFPDGGPKVVWRKEIGAGYTGPAVADGKVYVMDRPKPKEAAGGGQAGTERVLCLNAADGKELWVHEYPCAYAKVGYPTGPRTTPLVAGDKVYTLGTMGDLRCLDAKTGKLLWSKNFRDDYKAPLPVWGWSASLLLDGDRLISLVGGEDRAVMAFNKDTGKEIWKSLDSEEVCYSPPVLVEAGGVKQLVVWLDDAVYGLDPATGKSHWSEKYPKDGKPMRPAVTIAMPRFEKGLLVVTSFYHGPLTLRLAADKPAAEVAWRGNSDDPGKPVGIHALMATPVLHDGYVYGVCTNGEIKCIKADTGEVKWESMMPFGGKKTLFGTVFIIPSGDRFVLFTDQGDLILAKMSPKGCEEISRANVIAPSQTARGRTVVWSHPAFAGKCIFVRNDKEIACVSMAG
jgi:outer membrane protein assembly factor BamB